MANDNLTNAKRAKNDEFYTQWEDIQKEMSAYLEYNENVFKDKTILLPCDDPEWSNFTRFFAQNFERFGLKKLISTSYAVESKNYETMYQPTLFETNNPQYDEIKTTKNGKIFILDHDTTNDGKIDIDDLEWHYLEGDGDFKSDEIKALRDEADIIITNPPFSLFKEFLPWIMEANKKFVVIGNMNFIGLKELFQYIKEDKVWLGNGFHAGNAYFATPFEKEYAEGVYNPETGLVKFRNCCWYTNLDHGRRHQPLQLMSMCDNLKYHKKIMKDKSNGKEPYAQYQNYDAIEVPYTDAIPNDYDGVMGVPISFLNKYSPEQFEIVGMCENLDLYDLKTKLYTKDECKQAYMEKFGKKGTYDLNASGVLFRNGILEKVYTRVLIKHRNI